MQSFLHGRDLIGDLDFSKEEVETVLELAWDLKRKRGLNEPHAYLRDKVLAMLFFFSSTRTRGSFEAGMAQLGGHGAFIESTTTQIAHGDTAKEIGVIYGRYFDAIAIRHCDWQIGNTYINEVAKNSRVPVLNMQCDVLPSLPVPGRPDDHHGKERPGFTQEKNRSLLGLRSFLLEAHFRAPIPYPANAPFWHGCYPFLPQRIYVDARN